MADSIQEQMELIIRDANRLAGKNRASLNLSDEKRVIKHIKAARRQISEAEVLF